uniref:Phosphatidylinositol-specific phospholipase C X domain-containing protein n=1 Tax=Plectus sambesii TaxID=2011161 RepID=A0A914V3B9_9BILA
MSLENWMSELPEPLHNKPLTSLCIPGSHNSGTAKLNVNSPIGADQPAFLQAFGGQAMIRRAVYDWSKDQTLSFAEQLRVGVRFFDLRVAMVNGEPRLVHGLYCQDVPSALLEILEFLGDHPKEIAFIDFNHFYNFTNKDHEELLTVISSLFDVKLCPRKAPASNATLKELWAAEQQAIVFYQPTGDHKNIPLPPFVWTCADIKSPWPRTEVTANMLKEVGEILGSRRLGDGFQACQAIVTLDPRSVMKQPMGTFEHRYARQATNAVVEWLKTNASEIRSSLNILLCDFVDEANFCQVVVDLNRL